MISNNTFEKVLRKKECSAFFYRENKELFDCAVKSGLISEPERSEKEKITHAGGEDIHIIYKWNILEE